MGKQKEYDGVKRKKYSAVEAFAKHMKNCTLLSLKEIQDTKKKI